MLSRLFVRNIAIIDSLDLEFDNGFTTVTGETGAGKSIVVDAIALVLGGRGDTFLIRADCDEAEVNASFTVTKDSDAERWLNDMALSADGECILRRVIYRPKTRGTKAFINSRPVTVQALSELGSLLIDVHGQHEHQSLTQADIQRRIVDDFAGLQKQLTSIETAWRACRDLQQRIDNVEQGSADRSAQIDLLRYQHGELENLAPVDGEFTELANDHKRLAHASELLGGITTALDNLYDGESAAGPALRDNAGRIKDLAKHDEALTPVVELLDSASVYVEEAVGSLRQVADSVAIDPERLNDVDGRMTALSALARKHRTSEDALGSLAERIDAALAKLEESDDDLDALQAKLDKEHSKYQKIAKVITKARTKAATALSKAATEVMQDLGMAGGEFQIDITTAHDAIGRLGNDSVTFNCKGSKGQAIGNLSRIASGGELARISLAIDVVTTRVRRVDTLIFDEVDTGIGGGVAEVVGRLLRTLGDGRQVICVTHLPQVAAQANHQYQVNKHSDDDVQISFESLRGRSRVEEIARMLGGVDITRQTRAHAKEMLSKASTP